MAAVKDCPACGLVNPPTAVLCDCGWDFGAGRRVSRAPAEVRAVARDQKGVLAGVVMHAAAGLAGGVLPEESLPVVVVAVLCVEAALIAFVVRLAARMDPGAGGVALGLLALVPCVGVVPLLAVNARATAYLRGHGVQVGLLSARASDLR